VPSQWEMVIFGHLGSETPEPIHLKSGMSDYVNSPTTHAKYGGRRKWGLGWAYD